MKKQLSLVLALFLLGGCAAAPCASSAAAGMEMEEIDRWPDNAYTERLPEPEEGTPDYVIEGDGIYAVCWQDITREQGEAYLEAMRDNGFTQAAGESGDESAGFLLQEEGTSVAVSICEGVLGLYISVTE